MPYGAILALALSIPGSTATAQSSQEESALAEIFMQYAEREQIADPSIESASSESAPAKEEEYVRDVRVSASATRFDDRWIGSFSGSFEITEELTLNIELDTEKYISVGAGYGFDVRRGYVEPFFNYGRSELVDLYDLGLFAGHMVTHEIAIYYVSAFQWRRTSSPILGLETLDQDEWRSTLGVSYRITSWFEADVAVNHDRLVSGNRGLIKVDNRNITSGTFTVTFRPKWVHPYVRYTVGTHRVRPGEPITSTDSWEFGARVIF